MTAQAAVTPAQILGFPPRQQGIEISTPTAEQQASCKVELVKGGKGSGYVLRDPAGQTVRRFFDSNGDNKIDTWCYYKDGAEVYREIDASFNGRPDQYRWLNHAGSKWGLDPNEDGKIDSWKVISPQEVSQEIVAALATGNHARLQAMLLSEAELKALELSPAEVQRVQASLGQVREKFDETLGKLKGMEKATWIHLEVGAPGCRPNDVTGARGDLVSYSRGTVLYETGGKSDYLQTGEMVRVGHAWRLVEAPVPGAAPERAPTMGGDGATTVSNNPKLQKLVEELTELDRQAPAAGMTPGPHPAAVKHNLQRADLLEKIVGQVEPKDRELWIRQVADSLCTAVQNSPAGEKGPAERLARLEGQVVKGMAKGHPLSAYVVYRRLQADFSAALAAPNADYAKLQQDKTDRLTKFVETYPKTDDAAEALLQLGMDNEVMAKEGEARKWYTQLAKDYGDKPQGAKAKGALRRLEAEGKPLELSGPELGGSAFDMAKVKGKVVAVYHWTSWSQTSVGDFAKLKLLLDSYGPKGFELVCVSLDSTTEEADAFVKRTSAPGTHLAMAGGMESKLATDYGVMIVPHLFLVGKDGKVVSRLMRVNDLEEELKKLFK
jgi:hypothetical protein